MTAVEPSTLLEVTPAVCQHLPHQLQVWLWQAHSRMLSRLLHAMMADHTRVQHALSALSTHAVETFCRGSTLPEAGFLSHFLDNLPRLPVHTLNLATKCLQEETSIQEVVAEIKAHPALAAAVLTTINSAYYGLSQKSKPSTTPASC